MDNNNKELIKKIISEIVSKMGFVAVIDVNEEKGGNVVFNLEIDKDSHLLIGQHGINLLALQHITRLLVRKRIDEKVKFSLDVNDYRQQKNNSLSKLARDAAEQVLREKKAVALRPMTPYERRLVHLELAENKNIATESIGEGDERRVIIKPVGEVE